MILIGMWEVLTAVLIIVLAPVGYLIENKYWELAAKYQREKKHG